MDYVKHCIITRNKISMKKETIVYKPIPPKNFILMMVLFSKFLLLLSPFKFFIKFYLKDCRNIHFGPGFRFFYGKIFAENVYLNDTFIMDYAPVYIGEGSAFSFENMIITATHDPKDYQRIIAEPVMIGKNVWITSRCIILPGVTIGDNCVIGAGSVVTKDIPANSLAAGNPAKVIKKIKENRLIIT